MRFDGRMMVSSSHEAIMRIPGHSSSGIILSVRYRRATSEDIVCAAPPDVTEALEGLKLKDEKERGGAEGLSSALSIVSTKVRYASNRDTNEQPSHGSMTPRGEFDPGAGPGGPPD
jgi:hypothetical protein